MRTARLGAYALFAVAVLVGCAAPNERGAPDEQTDAKPESKPSPSADFKCVPLEKSVVKHFEDGAAGSNIRAKSAQAVKLSEPVTPEDSPEPTLNYAVAFAVVTPEGEQVALFAAQKLDGGGFTLAADETARKLFIHGADITHDDSPLGVMRAEVAASDAADAARACLK
jgi:hypothetical protein